MEVRFLPNDIEFWIQARVTPPRSEGLHVSVLVLKMLQEVSKHYRSWGKDRPERSSIYESGYAWEDALSDALARRGKFAPNQYLLPPEELALDDIYGTPDRILFDHDEQRFVVDEVKWTWMSCRGIDTDPAKITETVKFQYWLNQKKTYAAMLHFGYSYAEQGALVRRRTNALPGRDGPYFHPPEPPIAVIRALFTNGSYTGDIAKPIAWEFRYTEQELADWWAAVLRFRDEHFPLTKKPQETETT